MVIGFVYFGEPHQVFIISSRRGQIKSHLKYPMYPAKGLPSLTPGAWPRIFQWEPGDQHQATHITQLV